MDRKIHYPDFTLLMQGIFAPLRILTGASPQNFRPSAVR